jgi:hypothetical protein
LDSRRPVDDVKVVEDAGDGASDVRLLAGGARLGLGLVAETDAIVDGLLAPAVETLEVTPRVLVVDVGLGGLLAAAGFGCASTSMFGRGRINMPWPSAHSK